MAEDGHDLDVTSFDYGSDIDFVEVRKTSAFMILASDHWDLVDEVHCKIDQTRKSYWKCMEAIVNEDMKRMAVETNSCFPYSFAAFLSDSEVFMCKTVKDENRMIKV